MFGYYYLTFLSNLDKAKKKVANNLSNLANNEQGALDQWISVLVLAILAIVIFTALKQPIIDMLNGVVNKTGEQTNNLFGTQTK